MCSVYYFILVRLPGFAWNFYCQLCLFVSLSLSLFVLLLLCVSIAPCLCLSLSPVYLSRLSLYLSMSPLYLSLSLLLSLSIYLSTNKKVLLRRRLNFLSDIDCYTERLKLKSHRMFLTPYLIYNC